MTKTRKQHHMFTKEEIKAVAQLWNEKGVKEIAEQLGIESRQVIYLAREMRREGFILSRKHHNGLTRSLIKEVFESGEISVM